MNDKSVGFTITKNSKIFQTNFNRFFLTVESCLNVDFSRFEVKTKLC